MAYYTNEELRRIGFHYLGEDVRLSKNASIYNPSFISLGDHCRIDDFCVLSPGDKGISIGKYVHIGVHSTLIGQGKITLQNYCNISGRVSIYSSNDDYSGEWMTNPTVPPQYTNVLSQDIVVKKHTIVGVGSVILPGVTIGEGCAIGTLSLVKKDLEPYGVYGGIPAKRLKDRNKKLFELEKEFEQGVA